MEIKVADSQKMYDQCLEIRKRVFVEEQNVPMDREIDEYEDTSTHILLTTDTPVGTVRYRPVGDGTIKVERMAVDHSPRQGRTHAQRAKSNTWPSIIRPAKVERMRSAQSQTHGCNKNCAAKVEHMRRSQGQTHGCCKTHAAKVQRMSLKSMRKQINLYENNEIL